MMASNWSLQGVEVAGQGLGVMVDDTFNDAGFVNRILEKEGFLARGPGGKFYVDPDGWYPLEHWIRVFQKMTEFLGTAVFYEVGLKLSHALTFPASVKDAYGALQAMNTAYLMNHRKYGHYLIDPITANKAGAVSPTDSGIGYYVCEKGAGPKEARVRTENPYPCDLARGLLTGVAKRFAQHAFVLHDETMPCRKRGDSCCTYLIRWI